MGERGLAVIREWQEEAQKLQEKVELLESKVKKGQDKNKALTREDEIEIPQEWLTELKDKAEKATQGPWGTCLNAKELFGRKDADWGCVYANVYNEVGDVLIGCQLLRVNSNLMTEEERSIAHDKFFIEDIETNPGIMGANAEFIAAANPSVILALVDEIENLRARRALLDKEAGWLACELEKREHGCKWCEEFQKPCIPSVTSCGYKGPDNWREAARKAVMKNAKEGPDLFDRLAAHPDTKFAPEER